MRLSKKLRLLVCVAMSAFILAGCSDGANNNSGGNNSGKTHKSEVYTMDKIELEEAILSLERGGEIEMLSAKPYKPTDRANPISTNIYCADPTSVIYNGRLYVYGTNDQQQCDGGTDRNSYELIKSLVCYSTDDMVNWTYHGIINTGEIAPWIYNSWAPSIASRVEDDGLTHFYLYFSNSGNGVGVITATDPLGPWSDPLGKPLVYQGMPGLENCPAPFDPGVCIDENGVGWLAFGGGNDQKLHSFVPKIARLGSDMLSFDSEFVPIDAPFFMEASELNYIDGLYYYSYSTDWADRKVGWDIEGYTAPPVCSMAYLTTKTPLNSESWEYRGAFFYNSGENPNGKGMRWGNNHTHIQEYEGVNYIIHHTMLLEEIQGVDHGFRSMMVDYLPMDASTGEILITYATREGVEQIKNFDPYAVVSGTTMQTCTEMSYSKELRPGRVAAESDTFGSYIHISQADLSKGVTEMWAVVKGNGRIELRLDSPESEAITYVDFDCKEYTKVRSIDVKEFESGVHDIYLVFSEPGLSLYSWQLS